MIENSNIYELSLDPRVSINQVQVNKIAQVIKDLPAASQPDFVGKYLPPIKHPMTLDYFFAVTLQQFSFWETKDGKYDKPLLAVMNGKRLKGSSYLFYAYTRMLDVNPAFFTPGGQANLSLEALENVFRDDQGNMQMPAIELHLQQAIAYGRDMLNSGLTPQKLIEDSNQSEKPLGTFLSIIGGLGGYKEDPLQKKSNLLALCLSQRPEGFLKFGEDETIGPIVDYHCMRSILRTGVIGILGEDMRTKLTHRQIVSPHDEWAVRFASYQVLQTLVEISGRPISVVDEFLFRYMRSQCPEMTEPICAECLLDKVCAKRKEMFQPVIRTTFY
jgi:hypothetical protein